MWRIWAVDEGSSRSSSSWLNIWEFEPRVWFHIWRQLNSAGGARPLIKKLWEETPGDETGHFIPVPSEDAELCNCFQVKTLLKKKKRQDGGGDGPSEPLTFELFMAVLFDCSWIPSRAGGARRRTELDYAKKKDRTSTFRPSLNASLAAD